MKKRLLFVLILVCTLHIGVYAQNLKVQGAVVDQASGEPLIGVTVLLIVNGEATNTGTTTNIDGEYSLSAPATGSVVSFSYLGYQTTDIDVVGKSRVDVAMELDAIQADEIVVVGYGTQRKETLTGSISSVSTTELKQTPSANMIGSLAGKLPGLTIMQGSSQPGEESFTIRLRGVSTFGDNDQSPLILVDGVPRDNLDMIDPNEVESMSILKDASATAVFGVRGANGVILVTTKMGDVGKPKLSFSTECGIQQYTTEMDMMDSWDYATLYNQALTADNITGSMYSDRQIQLYKDGTNPLYPNIDWFDVMFKDYALITRNNFNISGATERVNYFVNLGLVNQGGMMNTLPKEELDYDPQFKLDRYNFRANLDIKANDWIKASLRLSGYIDQVNKNASSTTNATQFIQRIYSANPTIPYLANDYFEQFGATVRDDVFISGYDASIWAELNHTGYQQENRTRLNNSLALDFDLGMITKGLSARTQLSYDINGLGTIKATATDYNLYKFSILEGEDINGNPVDMPSFSLYNNEITTQRLSLSKSNAFSYQMNFQTVVNYARDFKKHSVTGMFLYQVDNSRASSGDNIALLPYNRIGYAARATYRYDDRYLAEFNVGYNGSEQFAADKRFGLFPAGSIGWIVSNEQFLKDHDVITNLKLRASYGSVGNDKIGSTRFLYLDNNTIENGGFSSVGQGTYISEALIGNPDLTWEVSYKQNYGVDLKLFKGLDITFDYFFEHRTNILLTPQSTSSVLGYTGGVLPKLNIGEMKNQGFELDINYRKQVNRDFGYSIRGTLNYANNTVINSDEMPYDDSYVQPYRVEGHSSGQQFGYLIDWDSQGNGYFLNQEEIDDYAEYSGTQPMPGDFVYKDLNEDGFITAADQDKIGSPSLPRFNYSMRFSLDYKGFDVSALFYGIGNSHIYYSGNGVSTGIYQDHHRNAWTAERADEGLEISYPVLSTTTTSSLAANDFFIVNRRFLRLKNMEVGYRLPTEWIQKVGLSQMRVYINGNNLFTWDSVPFDVIDPEQSSSNATLPLQRVINIGANITF